MKLKSIVLQRTEDNKQNSLFAIARFNLQDMAKLTGFNAKSGIYRYFFVKFHKTNTILDRNNHFSNIIALVARTLPPSDTAPRFPGTAPPRFRQNATGAHIC